MTNRMNIQVGDTFTNDNGNTCTIKDIHTALVTAEEELVSTDETGYTDVSGYAEKTYTFQEMRHMLNCRYLYNGDRFLN